MKEKRFGTKMQSVQNGAECCNRELLRRLEVQVMKEKRFGTKMQSAQNGAECCNRELLRRLKVQVMKQKRFGQKCRARKMVQNAVIESF